MATNVYTASEIAGGPIAEFSRGRADGSLTQLPGDNNCIQEQNSEEDFGCVTPRQSGSGTAISWR